MTPPSESSLITHLKATHLWMPVERGSQGVRDVRVGQGSAISYPEEGIELLQQHAESSWWIDHRAARAAALLTMEGIVEILDVGAGSGVMGERLAEFGVTTTSVEPHIAGALAIAARGREVFCGSLADVGFPKDSIPAISLFDVIEHLENPTDLLQEAHRVLEPNGRLLLTVPAHSWLFGEEDSFAGHYRRYSKKNLLATIEGAGFAPTYCSHLFACLVPPAFLIRRLPYVLGVRQGDEKMQARLTAGLAPSPFVVKTLRVLLAGEDTLERLVGLPFGLSLIAMFKKQ